ncbi:C4-dicarboxylate ABC transporter [Rhodococcus sp. 06-156-3C]|uniref:SLC13 family permease n=1 Tax=Nocardiaceae TaxID=85025 RepID=UPI000522FE2F|nr:MULTISPECIES: SLC13 family permease [Rhodococcus]OZD11338.1 C4-dicarboxylate ABC transporter [Rhodococcus sp. 06-156-3C]OZD13573.1 C4-dicarboxylate ABC transporter [Rhodococcus sp. 06-156-4a]OZD22088.1 C4-dicarboxylate ABC transporter [Rhodococcus sp. 06-156-4C]OZD30196.1 C4-dicarboxylate ABC transporter [Rhodococcus sp. 06-156-3]OZD37603.1 C4-dicarboxylate ABC transporter [Rhodococcus sp. 06-156-3b]
MIYFISIAALVALFAIATMTPINMGVLAFAAAFVVGGWLSGLSMDDIFGFFPGSIFTIIVGITLLFGIARVNGTVDLIVSGALKLVRGKRWAIVWLMFVLGAGLMTMGSVLAVGMLAPIAMPIAKRYKIDPLLMGMMISHGVLGAAFSPITVYGAFTNGWLQSAGLPTNPLALYLIPLGLSFVLALGLFLVRGRDLMKSDGQVIDIDDFTGGGVAPTTSSNGPRGTLVGASAPSQQGVTARAGAGPMVVTTGPTRPGPDRLGEIEATGFTPLRILTLIGMGALLIGSAVFQLDVGVCSMVIAAVLLVLAPNKHKPAVDNVTWSAVLLVCGMLTYMAVMRENGTLQFLGDAAASLSSPILTALILCYAVAAVSAVGSSIGTLGIVLPLASPLLLLGELGLIGFIAALSFSAVIVDVSPLSSNGVMVLANAQVPDRDAFQKLLFKYTGYIVAVAPLLAWLVVVLPTSL